MGTAQDVRHSESGTMSERESLSGSVTSWGECVVTPRAQLDEQHPAVDLVTLTSSELNQES